jgi:hypothetical protein
MFPVGNRWRLLWVFPVSCGRRRALARPKAHESGEIPQDGALSGHLRRGSGESRPLQSAIYIMTRGRKVLSGPIEPFFLVTVDGPECEVGMAALQVEDLELVLCLSGIEKAEAAHGDVRVPLSAVRSVEVLEDALEMTHVGTGFKVGMRVPGKATVAVVRRSGRKLFIAVHHDTPRAVRVVLDGASYDEWIVGASDPEAVIVKLNLGG